MKALKYHPDRNPGKEVEYNSKFQAIQSANEILTDPQQRAKYDAARMRAGLLYTYTNSSSPPTRPNVPPRPTTTNFPPPPRPPPAPAPKSQYPPPPSGAQKYARFNRPESTSTWAGSGSDEGKYKAWDQMRHGQGQPPLRRTVPPKVPRSATAAWQAGREPNGGVPRSSSRGRSEWDRFQEGHPGVARANTTRVSPRRPRFAPGTPGEDERQAPSAYFNVSRGERPTSSRVQGSMPPPPSPVHTAARKPDPVQAFRDRVSLNEPFGKKSRISTQYKTGGGERTIFESPGLHRATTSTTPKDLKRNTGLYETPHARAAAPATPKRNGKASPDKEQPNLASMYPSSSSSSSSSEDEPPSTVPSEARTKQVPKSRKGRMPAGAHRQTGFNLYASVEDAGDEPMAPQAGLGSGYYTGHRRHSAIDLEKSSDFHSDHAKHDGSNAQNSSPNVPSGASESAQSEGAKPSLSRSKSWQEKWGDHKEKWGAPPRDKDCQPAVDDPDRLPMYAAQGYTPFSSLKSSRALSSPSALSHSWSNQWPLEVLMKRRQASARCFPYWAIASCLPPLNEEMTLKLPKPHFLSQNYLKTVTNVDANNNGLYSFSIPKYSEGISASMPPLRNSSTEKIDLNFSPTGYHPKFFEPSPSRTDTPLRTVSPTEGNPPQQKPQADGEKHDACDGSSKHYTSVNQPPPPLVERSYSPQKWAAHLENLNFELQHPLPGRSTSRTTRKRHRTQVHVPTSAQATTKGENDDPKANSTTGKNMNNSKDNSDVDPMDLDEPSPPASFARHTEHQTNGSAMPPQQATPIDNVSCQAPSLPPRAKGHGQPEIDPGRFNLGVLKSTFPLAPSKEGLENMSDMATDLPFESRPSPNKPSANKSVSRNGLPNPPVFPFSPRNMTPTTCDHYLTQLRSYMEAWNTFNTDMIYALTKRQAFMQETSKCNWLDPKGGGYSDYIKGLKEHGTARAHFDLAYEHHEKSMKELGYVRDEIIRGRGGDGRKPPELADMLGGLL